MIRNLTRTDNRIDHSAARVIRVQQRSLDSLVQVVLNNIIALNYLLVAQGGVCAITKTCCTWKISLSRLNWKLVSFLN